MKQTMTGLPRFIPFIIWIAIVFTLLTMPSKDFGNTETDIPNLDKLVHMGLFGGIVFWYGIAVMNIDKSRTKTSTITVVILASLFGCAMEFVQRDLLHPPRDFSYGDMAADTAGATIAYFVIRWVTAKYQQRRLPKNTIKS